MHNKGKDKNDHREYRSISLTSILCKTIERIIARRLNWYIENTCVLANEQDRFSKFRSSNHHVILLSQMIKDALDKKIDTFNCFCGFKISLWFGLLEESAVEAF